MDNNEITKEIEIVPAGITKTFTKAQNDDASLYEFAGGEGVIAEFVRAPSEDCAKAMRRIKWRTVKNTRFVVYTMFFVILLVFSVYYAITKTYYIAALTGMVGAFMLYIVLFGESFFVSAMPFDEKGDKNSRFSVKLCENNLYVFDGEALSTAEYGQITQFKDTGKCIYLKLRGVKQFADGVILLKTEDNVEAVEEIIKKIPVAK